VLAIVTSMFVASAARADVMPDAWVTTKVRSGLLTTDGLASSRIHVDTIDGRVTLHGNVSTVEQKAQAEAVARSVSGISGVRNLLQVVPESARTRTKIADHKLGKNVEVALSKDKGLADSNIKVRAVEKGVVLLGGTVDSLSDHLRALEVTARVEGVRQVASEIQSPDRLLDAEIWRDGAWHRAAAANSTASDSWTTTAVKMRLLANTQTPGFDINVDTKAGIVTLFGVVDSTQTKATAEAEARKVDSVKGVTNALQIVAPSAQALEAQKDDVVHKAVKARFAANPQLAGLALEVKNGIVSVRGDVGSQLDRLTALTVARTTSGVRGILDDVSVVPGKVTKR
jgi:osmotically-inducible protein OsmY